MTTPANQATANSLHLSKFLARDVMHSPITACDPSTPISQLASLMGDNRIHCVIVEGISTDGHSERFTWGVVSDVDLLHAALQANPSLTADKMIGSTPLTVDADDNLVLVCAALAENGSSHAVVVDGGRPVGVISTLDIATVVAG